MSGDPADAIMLDLKGLICPDPLVRLTQALREAVPRQYVIAEVDFSPAVLTLTTIVQRQPWDLLIQGVGEGRWRLTFMPRSS